MNFSQIKIKPLPNGKQQRKKFPLLYAAEDGDLDKMKCLIKKRPGDLEKFIPNDGRTALNIAASKSYFEIVDELLEAHANVDSSDIEGRTALHWAVFHNHLDIAERLIRWNATVEILNGMTPLILASDMGHESLVALLIKSNADVNIQDNDGASAIHHAIYSKRDQVVLQLLQVKSLDVNIKNFKLSTPLHVACAKGSVGLIKPLVKRGANVNFENKVGYRPLHVAVNYNHCELVTELLNYGAQIDLETNVHITRPNQEPETPLMLASSNGYCSIIDILLKRGAEIDKKNKLESSCALHAAISRNQVKAVEVLLKAGADPNIKLCNKRLNYTLLVTACKKGYLNIVKLLLDNGAHANPVFEPLDLIYLSPIVMAASGGHNSIIKLLIERGANVNSIDSTEYGTALGGASESGHFNTVSLLLSRGCDVSNLRPLIVATKNGYRKVVELLIDACPKLVLFKFAIGEKDPQSEMCKVNSLLYKATIGQDREIIKVLMDRMTKYIMSDATEEEIVKFMSSELSHEEYEVLATCVVENKSRHQYVLDSLTETNLVAITRYAIQELKSIAKNVSHVTKCLTLLAVITCSRMALLDRSHIKEFESCLTNVKKLTAYGNKEPQAAVMLCLLAVGHMFPKDHINCIFQCKPIYLELLEQVLDNCNHDLQGEVLEEITFRIKDLVLEQGEVLEKCIEKLLEALKRKSSKESTHFSVSRLLLFLQNISGFEPGNLLSICLKLFSHLLQLKPADLKKSVTVLQTNAQFMEKVKVCCPELLELLNKEGVLESSIANDTIRSEGSEQHPKKKRKRKKKNKQTLESALEGIQLSSDVSDGMQEVESLNIQSPSQISDEENSATEIIEPSLKWTSKRWGKLLEKLNNLDEAELQKDVSPIKVCCRREYQIGRGSDGTNVYVGLMDDGTEVAVKRVYSDNDYMDNEKMILELTELRDPHIVQYKYSKKDSGGEYAYLILELCECTLEEYILKHHDGLKSRSQKIIEQLLKGLKKLHEQESKVLHRDLKPQNVFVDVVGNIRLADFGISRRLSPNQSTIVTKAGGSRCWRAQETLQDNRPQAYKASSDMQVAGMLVYYILSGGKHPYGDYEAEQIIALVQDRPNIFAVEDTVAKDLIYQMLKQDPQMRLSAKQCLRHPYFWPSKKRFAFLERVGNQQEVEQRRLHDRVVQDIYYITTSKPWIKMVDGGLYDEMSQHRKYSESGTDLLRFLRNTSQHLQSCSDAVKTGIGSKSEYFLKTFPELFIDVYRIIRSSQGATIDWTTREDLEDYFCS